MNPVTPKAFREDDFRKATASNPDKDCVRVARRNGRVEIRDDKKAFGAPDDHRLVLTEDEFDAYQDDVRAGIDSRGVLVVTRRADGCWVFRKATAACSDVELVFTESELTAFHTGVRRREFDALAFA
ncbi:DUF397 domain-containing protein [Amycolatopsis sp. NPDC059021]|uniref:DUF397 domain-containing protein n=1 Tax=Amycolatopsis sp. NPDC059021 TaxID=3346704 RepID=UPI00366ED13F